MIDGKPRIGDEVYIHGYIDEIRNDVVIIRNEGGYFGTSDREMFYYEEDERGYGTMNEADRKTEPNNSEKTNNCDTCRFEIYCPEMCEGCCEWDSHYEPKDEPQTYVINPQEPTNDEKCFECDDFFTCDGQCDEVEDEPQTNHLVETPSKSRDGHEIADAPLTDAEITELAKEIVHKMIDNSVIAEDAYPDLRQRMHEAVERLGEYYSSENERSE